MSRIINQDVFDGDGNKFEIITDMQGKSYETEVIKIVRENNRNVRKTVDKINLHTNNLTAASREHDKIVTKYCNTES